MPSDKTLLRQFLRGERKAFDALFYRYAAKVHATSLRLTGSWEDAEDVLQEVFIKFAEHARRIRSKDAVSSWIYRTTVNMALDHRRKKKQVYFTEPLQPHIVAMASLQRRHQKEDAREKERMLQAIEALLDQLPDRQATAVVLRGFQGLSHRQIAQIMGISESSAKSNFSRACQRLRDIIAESGQTEEQSSTKSIEDILRA